MINILKEHIGKTGIDLTDSSERTLTIHKALVDFFSQFIGESDEVEVAYKEYPSSFLVFVYSKYGTSQVDGVYRIRFLPYADEHNRKGFRFTEIYKLDVPFMHNNPPPEFIKPKEIRRNHE